MTARVSFQEIQQIFRFLSHLPGSKQVVWTLMEQGADLNVKDANGNSPLGLAIQQGSVKKKKKFCFQNCLEKEIISGYDKIAELLLDDIYIKVDKREMVLLNCVASNGKSNQRF